MFEDGIQDLHEVIVWSALRKEGLKSATREMDEENGSFLGLRRELHLDFEDHLAQGADSRSSHDLLRCFQVTCTVL